MLGLIEAVDRFEEGSQISVFPAYAQQRIRGAIYDELRRLDWLPRTIRRRVITYRVAVDDLSSELGRMPDRSEVMKEMGVDASSENDLMQQVQSAQLTHFQQSTGEDDWAASYRSIDQLVSNAAISQSSACSRPKESTAFERRSRNSPSVSGRSSRFTSSEV